MSTNPLAARRAQQSTTPAGPAQDRYFDLKTRVHQKLLGTLNMDALKATSRELLRGEVRSVVERILQEDRLPISMT